MEKVKNAKKPEDWRPINMLPTYEKILEDVVCKQLTQFIEQEGLLCVQQSGFRRGHSCETSICWLINEWKKEIEKGKSIIAIFLDLKRAFETIDRSILLVKLHKYGIRDIEQKWFQSYLSGRSQKVKIKESFSETISVQLGVPQGSKLGVLLFLIYINDIEKSLSQAQASLFADDTLIYYVGENVHECECIMQNEMNSLNEWLCKNKLKLNVSKTKCMCVNDRDWNFQIVMNGEQIERVNEIKYLGVCIDDKLRFNDHINNLCAKISKKIGFLKRIRRHLSLSCALTIYNTIILPHFDFCSSIIYICNSESQNRLQILQNRAMRTVLKCDYRTPIQEMLNTLKWLSVLQRLKLNALLMIFKIKQKLYPIYLQHNINYITNDRYNLRNTGDFRLPLYRRTSTQNNLLYKGLQLFNNLPNYLKNETNINIFKSRLTTLLKNNVL